MEKIYYPRCIGSERFEDNPKRQKFYDVLEKIRSEAVSTDVSQGDFYTETTYTMKDGKQFLYTENSEYGIPYSIEEKEIDVK